MPAAEPEIEPRCPGLVSKLPALSRRAMSRLRFQGNFLPVSAGPRRAPRIPQPADGPRCSGAASTHRHSPAWGHGSGRAAQGVPAGTIPCVAVPPRPVEQAGGLRAPFPPRCAYGTGQLVPGFAWRRGAAGACVSLPAGLAEPRQCLAPQPQSLVRKKLKATQFWLISLCRPLTPPVTNPFIIALF